MVRGTLKRGWIIGLMILAAVCLAYLSSRHPVVTDWSGGQRASLSATSRAVLGRMHEAVNITSYARPGGEQRRQISAFIARYQRFKPDITLDFVDPEADPAATRAAGITVNGELVVRYRDQREYLRHIDERHLTNALETLARGDTRIAAFVTGNGERRASGSASGDMGELVEQLEQRGMRAVPLNFAQVSRVPQGARLVVLASPVKALPEGAVGALVDYVRDGGNLLWLTEPESDDGHLQPLFDQLGVQKLPGVLVDGQGSALGSSDPRLVAAGHYPDQSITRDFDLTTLFPQVAALARASLGDWKVTPFLRSGVQSWNERTPITNAATSTSTIRHDAGQGESKGPLNFGLALTRLSPGPGHNQQRVAVIGDGDFLSNAYLGKGGNRELATRVFNWLLGDDALIGVPPPQATSASLGMTQRGLNMFLVVFVIALPLLLTLWGLLLGWRRRRR